MGKHLFELIMDIRKKCIRTEEQIRRKLDLTPGEFNGLLAIEFGEKITGLAFADRLGLSPSRASRVLSALMKKGFMEQEPQLQDRRNVNAFLTRQGKDMRKKIFQEMSVCEKRIIDQLNQKQFQKIYQALSLLAETM
jgi:DNA-binding MarR family transcriptional regulator